jgi:HAMP domain-containing protein
MEKIRNLGLKWKCGIVVFVVLVIIIAILLGLLRRSLTRELDTLYGDPSKKGVFVGRLLSTELKPFMARDIDALEVQDDIQRTVNNIYKAVYGMYSVRYLFLQNGTGGVIVDTFGDKKVPQSIVELNPLGKEGCAPFNSSGNKYVDCTLPLKFKDKATGQETTGAIRVGILDQNPQSEIWQKLKTEHVDGVFNPIFYMALLFVVILSVLLTLAFWYFVLRRVVGITEATERMSFGDLDTVVPIKSQDEIGTLEDTLERMRANLKDAIERLKRRK